MSASQWRPMGTRPVPDHERPGVGDVIALHRRAWRVTHLSLAEPTEAEAADLAGLMPEYRERYLPYRMTLQRLHGPTYANENGVAEAGFRVPARAYRGIERYTDDRVPLCSCCGHPWPCLMTDAAYESARAGALLDERLARVGPGICYGCGEPITTRQGSVRYPEPNVQIPGAPEPRFHTRRSCLDAVLPYERDRARLIPGVAALFDATTGTWNVDAPLQLTPTDVP